MTENIRTIENKQDFTEDSMMQAILEMKKLKKTGRKLGFKPTHIVVHPSWLATIDVI